MTRNHLGSLGLATLLLVFVAACESQPTNPQDGLDVTFSHTGIDGEQATSLNGGGHIREGDYDISFGGGVEKGTDGWAGDYTVQFHNVSVPEASGGTFEATSITDVNLYEGDNENCDAALNMTMDGTFNGEPGWSITIHVGDAGHTTDHDAADTYRVHLYDEGTKVYDSSDTFGPGGDFPSTSNCVGTARTHLDAGNVKIK